MPKVVFILTSTPNTYVYDNAEGAQKAGDNESIINKLPDEILLNIFSKIGLHVFETNYSLVCKRWKELISDKKLLENELNQFEQLYNKVNTKGMDFIQAMGGIKSFLRLPQVVLAEKKEWNDIYYVGSIPLASVTHGMMRGVYYDGLPFISIRYTYEWYNKKFENVETFYIRDDMLLSTSSTLGATSIWSVNLADNPTVFKEILKDFAQTGYSEIYVKESEPINLPIRNRVKKHQITRVLTPEDIFRK